MSLLWFAEWLDTHEWSTALHESLWAYPIIESTHVLSIMWFVGTIIFVDLRLLGHCLGASSGCPTLAGGLSTGSETRGCSQTRPAT